MPKLIAGNLNVPSVVRLQEEEAGMLRYALIFLVIAIIAGILGFGGIAFAAAGIAKILFFIFLILFVVGLIMHLGRGRPAV